MNSWNHSQSACVHFRTSKNETKMRGKTLMFSQTHRSQAKQNRVRNDWQTFANWWATHKKMWLLSQLYISASHSSQQTKRRKRWQYKQKLQTTDRRSTPFVSIHPLRPYKSWLLFFFFSNTRTFGLCTARTIQEALFRMKLIKTLSGCYPLCCWDNDR